MKKIIYVLVISMISISLNGQKSIDSLFDKYSGSDDFTSVTISGNFFKIAKAICDDDCEEDYLPDNITTIRILAQNNERNPVGNFYEMVQREIDRRNYEEFMSVKKFNQDLVMLVRTSGRNFKEFLVVAGGEDNVVIQIKGNLTFKEAERFSEHLREDCGRDFVDEMN